MLNKALVVDWGLMIDDRKKDFKSKKRVAPTRGFDESRPSRMFNYLVSSYQHAIQEIGFHVPDVEGITWLRTVPRTQDLV